MDKFKIPNSSHGATGFDRDYYRKFFEKYSVREFGIYCRWAEGMVRFLDSYLDLKKSKGKKVLELGASLGYFSRIFKDRGFDVWASDISSFIVKKAHKLQKDIKFSVIDAEKRIKIGQNFDYIIAFDVVEHFENPEAAFKNIFKKLKNGGCFILSTPFPTKRSLSDPTHINVHNASWWLKLSRKTGFRKPKVIYATFVPFLYRISKYLSIGFPFKSDLPYVNSTCFIILKK